MNWGDLITLEYGKPVKDKNRWDGAFPVFGTNGQIGTSDLEPLCKHASFILGRKGAFRGVHYSAVPFSVIDTAFYAEVISDEVDLHWAYYKFLTYDINSMDSGSAIPSTDRYEIYSLPINLPTLDVQRKVVTILDGIDQKILLNRRINDNLAQQAVIRFSEWLSSCTESITIGDMSNNVLDYSPANNEMIRLLNSSDVTEGVFPVSPLVQNKDLKGHFKKRFQYGDVLYSEIRPRNHHYGFVLFDASEYIASTRLMVIRAKADKVSPAVLYQYLLLPEVEAEFTLKTESRSGTFPQGNYADMSSIVVPYAPVETQEGISDTLSQIRHMIALNQCENQRLTELRDALLPKLMSGELDVSDIDI